MTLASPKYSFREAVIRGAPEDSGLYALYRDNEIQCIGIAVGENTIRSRLLEHFHGDKATSIGITHYQWEIAKEPLLKRDEYVRKLAQKYPHCEDHPTLPQRR